MFENVIGISSGWRKIEYNWRDVALYALAVGAEREDLQYFYEKDKRGMKALPSFASVQYYSAVNNEPQQPLPRPANYYASDAMSKEVGYEVNRGFHMGYEMVMKKPIDPIKGTLVYNNYVDKLYDRGEGKGTDLEVKNLVYDEGGDLICENTSYHRFPNVGGWGGPAPVKIKVEYPEREPDYVVESYISPVQNALYRLTGDTNESHINPEAALKQEPKGVFMQGLSSFGFACRMAIKAVIPGEPERMKRIYVQMRAKAFPDTPVELRAWKVADKKIVFKYIDKNTRIAILDNCEFEWE